MNCTEASERLERLERRLRDRGYVTPGACFHVRWLGENYCVHLEYKPSADGARHTEFVKASVPGEAFAQAEAFIADLPDVDTLAKRDFLVSLGALIDTGHKIGVDVEFMNPLTAAMKRLSENVITKVAR